MTIQYICLACRSLAEAVKYGLENEDIVSVNMIYAQWYDTHVQQLVCNAAFKLVECCGYNDIEMTCQYLALYQVKHTNLIRWGCSETLLCLQSCVASKELYQLLLQAQSDAGSSQLASLLQQRLMLQDKINSTTYIANTHLLNEKYEVSCHSCGYTIG